MDEVERMKKMIRQTVDRFGLDKVEQVEAELNEYDKISLYYLLNDDPAESLAVLNNGLDRAVSKWCYQLAQGKMDEWKLRLIESLMLMQMYRCLQLLGYKKTDLTEVRNLLDMAYRSKNFDVRKALYSAVDTMTEAELERFVLAMDGELVSRGYKATYIEYYLLEWQREGKIVFEMESLNDLVITLDNHNLTCASESLRRSLIGIKNSCLEDVIVDEVEVVTPSLTERRYPIHNRERIGLCIILNQKKYWPSSNHSVRWGSDLDVKKLVHTMNSMKLDCQELNDLTGDQIFPSIRQTVLKHFKRNIHSVLIVVIMAHGDIDQVFGVDGKAVNISCRSCHAEDSIGVTLSNERLRCLTNIPKVLIIQACRGQHHKGESDAVETFIKTPKIDKLETDGAGVGVIPWMDHYISCYPTVSGFKAYRSTSKGSPYIHALCDHLLASYRELDIISILTGVNREFNQDSQKLVINGLTVSMLPEINSTLIMPLYLYPS